MLDKRNVVAAFASLTEGAPMFSRLGSVSAYVNEERSDPGAIEELCHEVETFVLVNLEWA